QYVVDTGLARVKRYSYRNKVEMLRVEPISRAAANQRAGRCGRVAQGVCIRLYSELDFDKRPAFADPELLRSSLASVILRAKRRSALGAGSARAPARARDGRRRTPCEVRRRTLGFSRLPQALEAV